MSIYLRFKRGRQTLFLPCELASTLEEVKLRLAKLVEKDLENIRLHETIKASSVLDDEAAVEKLQLKNDQVIYFVFRDPVSEEWETPFLDQGDGAEADGAAPRGSAAAAADAPAAEDDSSAGAAAGDAGAAAAAGDA